MSDYETGCTVDETPAFMLVTTCTPLKIRPDASSRPAPPPLKTEPLLGFGNSETQEDRYRDVLILESPRSDCSCLCERSDVEDVNPAHLIHPHPTLDLEGPLSHPNSPKRRKIDPAARSPSLQLGGCAAADRLPVSRALFSQPEDDNDMDEFLAGLEQQV
jgi:hypothetical protein